MKEISLNNIEQLQQPTNGDKLTEREETTCCQKDHADLADDKMSRKEIDKKEKEGKERALLPDHKNLGSMSFRGNILPRGRNGRARF